MPSHYIRTYNTLSSGTGKICRDEGIGIDRNDYANGYALYTFDLTSDLEDEKNFNLMRQRSVRSTEIRSGAHYDGNNVISRRSRQHVSDLYAFHMSC